MRRLALLLTLPLLLLLAQQGALLHELSHAYYVSHAQGPQASTGDTLPDNAQCVTCQTFGQLAYAASASAPPLQDRLTSALRIAPPLATLPATHPPIPRSRGPPQLCV